MAPPLVSLILAIHNGAEKLSAAIHSVVEQTFGDWEMLAVDDGSTDDTYGTLSDWAARDPRTDFAINASGTLI